MNKINQQLQAFYNSGLLQRWFLWAFLAVNVLYLLHLILLGWFNQLALDDYCFLYAYNEYGFADSFHYWYTTWQGRVSAYVLINSVLATKDLLPSLFLYQVGLIGLFLLGFYQSLRFGLQRIGVQPTRIQLLTFSIYLLNLFVFFTFDFSTFYWLNVSTMYFAGVAFALIGTAALLNPNSTIWSWLGAIIGFAWACCSSENFGLICLGFLFLNLVGHWVFAKKLPIRHVAAFLAGTVMFAVMFLAPGNALRQANFPEPTLMNTLSVAVGSYYHFLFYDLRPRIGEFILVALPMLYFGTIFRQKDTSVNPSSYGVWLLVAIAAFFVFLFFTMLPTSYALSVRGPERALTHIAFYFVLFLTGTAFFLGFRTLLSSKAALAFGMIGLWTLGFFAVKGLAWNVPETAHYAKDEVAKIAYIQSIKDQIEPGSLVPVRQAYYQPGVVVRVNKLVKIPGDWHNRCLRKGLGLKFELVGVPIGEEMPPVLSPEDNPVKEWR